MLKWFYRSAGRISGKNLASTPTEIIVDQLNEMRPLPMGRQEFEEWAGRIISGALVSADADSQMFALANMLMHLGPTESHKPDAHFIHSLRKVAVNQVADVIRKELHEAAKARHEALNPKSEAEKAVEAAGQQTLERSGAVPVQ